MVKSLSELLKLANDSFNIDTALMTAQDLKHLRQIMQIIKNEVQNPSEAFIRFFASQIWNGAIRASVIEEFKPKVKNAFNQYLNNELVARVQKVTGDSSTQAEESAEALTADTEIKEQSIETTAEELEAFMIVKAILRPYVSIEKIAIRDRINYCGVLYENNNRKPICRFYFNSEKNKSIATFDENKQEIKHKIESLDNIYEYSEQIISTVNSYIE